MAGTKIEWAQKVWNPVTGCSKISPGCQNCYAERMSKRLAGRFGYPKDDPFKVTLRPDRLDEPLKWRKPSRIFVCSMGDLFHEDVEWNFTYKIFEKMLLASHHQFIVLTKRSKQMRKTMLRTWFHLYRNYPDKEFPLPNVIGMVTIENQEQADKRIPDLIKSEFAIKGLSIEPMLGAIDLSENKDGDSYLWDHNYEEYVGQVAIPGSKTPSHYRLIDWVILGAESGPKRRPCYNMEILSVVNQCKEANVPVFVKQIQDYKGNIVKDINKFPKELQVQQYPEAPTL